MKKLIPFTLLSLAASVFGQLQSGETIGIDFASDNPVFGTPNDVDPANGTNFNKFDRDINDGGDGLFRGHLGRSEWQQCPWGYIQSEKQYGQKDRTHCRRRFVGSRGLQ